MPDRASQGRCKGHGRVWRLSAPRTWPRAPPRVRVRGSTRLHTGRRANKPRWRTSAYKCPGGPYISSVLGVTPRYPWLPGSSLPRYASTSTMRPTRPRATNNLPSNSGATSTGSRAKKGRRSRRLTGSLSRCARAALLERVSVDTARGRRSHR